MRIYLDKMASKKALDLMEKFPEKMAEANEISLYRVGFRIRTLAGENAPYITGNLKRSLTNKFDQAAIFEQKKNQVTVGSNLKYAKMVEFRPNYSKKRLYLTRATDKIMNEEASKIYSEEIETVLQL